MYVVEILACDAPHIYSCLLILRGQNNIQDTLNVYCKNMDMRCNILLADFICYKETSYHYYYLSILRPYPCISRLVSQGILTSCF